ncbi:MAG: response regulator transcription factor [Clostridiales bacterium]|jgi:DNA-binding response OmpR family regulator|nr:response regulator transcription factor [Clostridiales bacterium]MDR2751297.1 response regulator transcription factor [Clostridiales bacterium]
MHKILIVDDEPGIRALVREYAEFIGHSVTEAEDGMEAVTLCRDNDFDIVFMDIMMPRMDGFSACKEIRKCKDVPVLMLSARGEEYDKLFGFEVGIDDYVVKPFSPKELMARANAIIARCAPKSKEAVPELLQIGSVSIDAPGRNVYVDGQKVELTTKEYDLLYHLVSNKNTVFSREQLLKAVWGYDFFGDDRTVDTHVRMLRSSLGKYRDYIVTIRGVGYKFEVQ